jgi:hypothetical protein
MILRIVIVITLNGKAPEEALHLQNIPAFAQLAGFGLIACVGLVGGFLEEKTNDGIGGFEDRSAQEHLQFLNLQAVGMPDKKAGHQLGDFFFLSEGEVGRFFLEPPISARVLSMMSWAYWSLRRSN